MKLYQNTQDVIDGANILLPGNSRYGVIDLPSMVREDGPVGESLKSFLVRCRFDPSLRLFELGVFNIINLTGNPNADELARAVACIGKAPIVISNGTEKLRELALAPSSPDDFMTMVPTTHGSVVQLSLNRQPNGDALNLFINPKGMLGFEFMMGIFSFPMLTWAIVEGDHVMVCQISRASWPEVITKILSESSQVSTPADSSEFTLAINEVLASK